MRGGRVRGGRARGGQAPLVPLGVADVVGRSMLPRLRPGDRLLVRWGAQVRPGDLVVVAIPDRPGLHVVKRAAWREPCGWWVLGDNPAESEDSRRFGAVPDIAVVARVLLRVWPPRRRQPTARRRAR